MVFVFSYQAISLIQCISCKGKYSVKDQVQISNVLKVWRTQLHNCSLITGLPAKVQGERNSHSDSLGLQVECSTHSSTKIRRFSVITIIILPSPWILETSVWPRCSERENHHFSFKKRVIEIQDDLRRPLIHSVYSSLSLLMYHSSFI